METPKRRVFTFRERRSYCYHPQDEFEVECHWDVLTWHFVMSVPLFPYLQQVSAKSQRR